MRDVNVCVYCGPLVDERHWNTGCPWGREARGHSDYDRGFAAGLAQGRAEENEACADIAMNWCKDRTRGEDKCFCGECDKMQGAIRDRLRTHDPGQGGEGEGPR